jgi:hypothetical protein
MVTMPEKNHQEQAAMGPVISKAMASCFGALKESSDHADAQ